ncbi:MAG: glucose 1-dehydrogenase [Minwuiales bacterium]|nr:glucose 1-dehydrogenase [Minwuiales bacterium]
MGKLDGQAALITGGASGIGQSIAERFADEGARVVIADIQDERGHRLAERLGNGAGYVRTDVSKAEDIEAAVRHTVDAHGRLDCLVNNAGFPGVLGNIEEISIDGYDTTMSVLLRAVLLGMKYAAPVMKRQGKGSIISTASVAGITTSWSTPHVYNTAKAAVIHLTRSVALELGEHGVRVNCICPGFIATPIFGRAMDLPSQMDDQVPEAVAPLLADRQPIKRAGQPEDIANAALWLASDEASFVNGHAMVVDGGITVGTSWRPAGSGETQQRVSQALGLDTE